MAGGRPGETESWSCVCMFVYWICVLLCVCVSVYLCLCWSMLDRELGLGQQSAWGFGMWCGGEKVPKIHFFSSCTARRGEEAGVLFFLALALTALSGYWSGALMQTCQINFAGRKGLWLLQDCFIIERVGWMDGGMDGSGLRVLEERSLWIFIILMGSVHYVFYVSLGFSTFPFSVKVFCDFTHNHVGTCKIIHKKYCNLSYL